MKRYELCAFLDGLSERLTSKLALHDEPLLLLNDETYRGVVQALAMLKYCMANPFFPESEDSVDVDPFTPVAHVDEPKAAEPEPHMSIEDLRAKLSAYSNKYNELDVAAIMGEMGYHKLSSVPPSRYSELLERVEASIKEGA